MMLWSNLYCLPISANNNLTSHNTVIRSPALTQVTMNQVSKTLWREIRLSMQVRLILKSAIHAEGHSILLLWKSTPRFAKKFLSKNARSSILKSIEKQLMPAAKVLKIKIMEDEPSNSLKLLLRHRRKVRQLTACRSGRFKVCSLDKPWVQTLLHNLDNRISTLLKYLASQLTTE